MVFSPCSFFFTLLIFLCGRKVMSLTAPHGSVAAATVADVQWKVDVLMTSLNEVEQVAVPVAIVAVRLTNHVVLTYTLTPEELHQWRFALAKGMRDVLYLQSKQPPHTAKKVRNA